MKSYRLFDRCTALLLTLVLLLSLAACSGGASATTMRLKRAEGTVAVSDDAGEAVELLENLGLYSGYGVGTRSESYAWIDLDHVKLTKMDQESEIAIQKEGKRLEIEVMSGALFFNVTEPLAEDETMSICTSTMLVGIRGTCGWVEVPDAGHMDLYLLEGTVECSVGDKTATVHAGEMAAMSADGEITVTAFAARNIPAFVREEIEDNDGLAQAILDASGIDIYEIPGNPPAEYRDVLNELKQEGDILYTEMVDFEADGNPELLVLHTRNNDRESELLAVSVYRAGSNGVDDLFFGTPRFDDRGKFSLVGHGDRIVMGTYRISDLSAGGNLVSEVYYGSVAEKDGVNPSWSGDDKDWGMLDWISWNPFEMYDGPGISYSMHPHDQRGFANGQNTRIDAEEYAAIQAQYNELRVLAYSPDGETLIITPDPSEVEEFPQPAVTP